MKKFFLLTLLLAFALTSCGTPKTAHRGNAQEILSEILAEAIHAGIITPADLYLQEIDVVEKLESSSLLPRWQAFRKLKRVIPAPGGRVILAKKRYIDPCTCSGQRASRLDEEFAGELADFLNHSFDYGLMED